MNNSPVRITIAAAALIVALTMGVRAADVRQIHVKYPELDVNSPAGAAALLQRIRFAADQVCAFRGTRELSILTMVQACTHQAIADAVAKVNNPSLTGLYEAKMGRARPTRIAAVR
jgi:UrcA family protein